MKKSPSVFSARKSAAKRKAGLKHPIQKTKLWITKFTFVTNAPQNLVNRFTRILELAISCAETRYAQHETASCKELDSYLYNPGIDPGPPQVKGFAQLTGKSFKFFYECRATI